MINDKNQMNKAWFYPQFTKRVFVKVHQGELNHFMKIGLMIVLKYNKAILGSFLGLFNSKLMTSCCFRTLK